MSLDEPVVAYIADSNQEAQLLQQFLIDQGIPAHAIVDESKVGQSLFGNTTLHRPKGYVNQCDLRRADEFLEQFERMKAARLAKDEVAAPIDTQCEECGKSSTFAARLVGTSRIARTAEGLLMSAMKTGEVVDPRSRSKSGGLRRGPILAHSSSRS